MDSSSLLFLTCDQLREAFTKCHEDINKRVLIIDVRDATLYNQSHLCLDSRTNISSIKTKMRVMNIDPDLVKLCTSKSIMSLLKEDDLNIYKKRKDATDVVLIDRNTDNINELSDPRSKATRLINALTRYDNQPDDKIIVPVHILKGGYREWLLKYPHFTTNANFDPEAQLGDFKPMKPKPTDENDHSGNIGDQRSPIKTIQDQSQVINPTIISIRPNPTPPLIQPQPRSPYINKPPMPTPNSPSAPKPALLKNAPGTAVPVTPVLSLGEQRYSLSRSHSSPNVAQADGDEPETASNQLDKLTISKNSIGSNNNNYSPSVPLKPRFDRTLKPLISNESINTIRSKLNFGRSPEASGKAITGLQNLGNTCFMNSVIQCLAYAPSLATYFCSESYYNHINFNSTYGSKGELAIEFGALVEKLNAYHHRYIEPKSFREAVVKHIGFAGNEQQDSHEFMMMLFDKLHHDLNTQARDKFKQNGIVSTHSEDDANINIPRATLGYQFWKRHLEMNKSIISDLFEGIFMSTLTCSYCKGQSNTFEVFNCLSLPIPTDTRCHLRDCLSHFSNPEKIEAAWECPRCKMKREAEKKIVICKLPRNLVIHLKRFSLDGRWRQKLQTPVDFPLTDLNVEFTNVLPQSAYSIPSKSSYGLYAIINHYGHLDGGHYTAFCKLSNQKWYTFDDSTVSEMKDSDVHGQAAYMLFYGANY